MVFINPFWFCILVLFRWKLVQGVIVFELSEKRMRRGPNVRSSTLIFTKLMFIVPENPNYIAGIFVLVKSPTISDCYLETLEWALSGIDSVHSFLAKSALLTTCNYFSTRNCRFRSWHSFLSSAKPWEWLAEIAPCWTMWQTLLAERNLFLAECNVIFSCNLGLLFLEE